MAIDFTPRQADTIAAAITTVAALVILVAVGLLGWLIAVFVQTFSGVFLPLAVSAVAALVFRPYYYWLRYSRRLPVAAAVAIVFLSALVPLGAFVTFFGRLAIAQIVDLVELVERRLAKLEGNPDAAQVLLLLASDLWCSARNLLETLFPLVSKVLDWLGLGDLLDDLGDRLREAVIARQAAIVEWLRTVSMQTLTAGFGLARGLGAALLSWGITPIYFAWFLTARFQLDTDHMLPFLKPSTRKDAVYLLREFVNITVAFFRGQLIIALLQGALFAAGFVLVGLRYGFVIGLALGLLNVIPYLGTMLGLAIAIPIAFFQTDGGWLTCLLVLAVVLVVQQIEGWFLTPKIMGQRTGLHYMAIIVAVFFWGTALGGILGLILAIPLTAFLASLWHLAREKYIPEIV